MKIRLALLYSALAFVLCIASYAIAMTVNVHPYGEPQVTTFDPDDPPEDLDDYNGDAECDYDVDGRYDLSTNGKEVMVSNLTVDLTGHTDIRLPEDADPNLVAHENGHDELNRFEYERYAKGKVEKAFEGFERKRPIPDGNTPQQVAEQIKEDFDKRIDKAKAAIKKQLDMLSARYDANDLTAHGDNFLITAADAVKKVKEEKEKGLLEPQEEGDNVKPNGAIGKQQVSGIGAVYDMNDVIMWDPHVFDVNSLLSLLDTINGRGRLKIDGIIPLGPDRNSGGTGCSDSRLQVFDAGDLNNIFFDASLYNIRILPSNKPGYSQMIQAYLNIWQVNNSIGSEFLAFMQMAQLEDEYTSFWFYATDRLVDEDGNWVATGMVPGQVFLGVATNADVTMTDDFEGYDPVSFAAAWQPSGGAMTMLEIGMAHSGDRAMRLMVNNPPMTSSQAAHLYPVPQDFSGEGRTLDISMRLEMPSTALDSFYVVLTDTLDNAVRYDIADSHSYGHSVMYTSNSDWLAVSIDMREFASLNTAGIARVSLGFVSGTEPLFGGVLVDDILVHQRRELYELKGDLNNDHRVDFRDVAILADNWLQNSLWPGL
jgi:hypothetical protein